MLSFLELEVPGDVVIVTPEPIRDVRPGQVITYAIPVGDHHVETHRVVRVVGGGDHPVVITKGDANAAADPWKAELSGTTVWRYRFRIPMLGRAIVALRDPLVHKLTVLLLPALLFHAGRVGGRRALARTAAAPALLLAGSLTINAVSSHHCLPCDISNPIPLVIRAPGSLSTRTWSMPTSKRTTFSAAFS